MEFVDRLLTCNDCGSTFVFTAGEQLFFFDKQFKNDPKRCKLCKSKRDAKRPGSTSTGLLRTETRTQCSSCGVETTVPFKPTQGRPVLCRQCFQQTLPVPSAAKTDSVAEKTTVELNATTAEIMSGVSSSERPLIVVELPHHISRV